MAHNLLVRLKQGRHKLGFLRTEEGQAKLAAKGIREGLLEEVTLELSAEGTLGFRRQGMGEGHCRRGDSRTKVGKHQVCSGLGTRGGLMA